MYKFFNRNWKAGFTLVELVVVIAILAILAGIAIPVYSGYIQKANQAADEQLLGALNTAYAAACVENGNYDMKNLGFVPVATLTAGVPAMSKYDDEFQVYFGNNAFKYYESLFWSKSLGGFTGTDAQAGTEEYYAAALAAAWEGTSFDEIDIDAYLQYDTVAELLNDTFEGCGELFQMLLDNTSWHDNMAAALNMLDLDGVMSQIDTAMDRDAAVAYLASKGIDSPTEDQIKTVQGNMAVMVMVNDAANTSVDKLIENYNTYREVATDAYQKCYEENGNFDDWMSYVTFPAGFDATTSASTLGAVYGLAMGYYERSGNPQSNYGDSFTAINALFQDDFFDYFDAHAADDLNAYLSYMNLLSTQDIDLTRADAFTSLNDYMSAATGNP